MTIDQIEDAYARATPEARLAFLVDVIHGFTVFGRYAYWPEVRQETRVRLLRVSNECIHQAAGAAALIARGKRDIDTLGRIMCEVPEPWRQQVLAAALLDASEWITNKESPRRGRGLS